MGKKFTSALGYEATIGKFAQQADSSVWIQKGGTVILATLVTEQTTDFPGFLPLTVDYREQFAAAGRIPGGYFKREGKPTEREVLTGRLIDRSVRPLFPADYFEKTQLTTIVYSVDRENTPAHLALIGSSLALTISDAPFLGPVGVCEIAHVDGEWIYNPTHAQATQSDVKILVAGNEEGINMVEGTAHEISESTFIDIIFQAHKSIKQQIEWQQSVQRELGVENKQPDLGFDWDRWQRYAHDFITKDRASQIFIPDKIERSTQLKQLEDKFCAEYQAEIDSSEIPHAFVSYMFDRVLKERLTQLIFERNQRLDTRDFTEIRDISGEVGLLPYNHGSAMFQRGRTQVVASATLGGGRDEARVDSLMGEHEESFMLHYNFPPFSVGEARPWRAPSRREVGHGHLAGMAIEPVVPSHEDFSYTIRVVADAIESDGSTSMATVCASTMAMMSAGVPIKKMVSGVAMGLICNEDGDFRVLTDIAGMEDAFGLMDFKVAGTVDGITAIQMDIKYKGGLSRELFEQALEHARSGRLGILDEMKKVISEPRPELSDLVPRVVSFKIPQDKIGTIIGPGGRVVKEIIDKTGATIDVGDEGLVRIFGHPGAQFNKAITWVKALAGRIESGDRYEGEIKRVAEYGLLVEVAPGQNGLVHISTVPKNQQDAFLKSHSEGEAVTVEVIDYDASTGRIRLKLADENR